MNAQNPAFQWMHPKPFISGIGWIKAPDANNVIMVGAAISFSLPGIVVRDANNVIMVGAGGTFFKSVDGGATFEINSLAGQASTTSAAYDLYGAHFLDINNGYATGIAGVMKTTNSGMTWSNASGSTFPTSSTGRKIYFRDANNGYVAGTSSFKLSTTTDGGNSRVVYAALPSTTYYDLEVFSANRIIAEGSVNLNFNIRMTTDGGSTWQTSAAGTSTVYSPAFTNSLTGYCGSSSGRAYKTTDGGLTWNQLTTNTTTSTFYDIVLDGSDLYFIADPKDLYKMTDGGVIFTTKRFISESLPRNLLIKAGEKRGSNIWLASDAGYYFRSTDNGATRVNNTYLVKTNFVQGIYANANGKIIAAGGAETVTAVSQ